MPMWRVQGLVEDLHRRGESLSEVVHCAGIGSLSEAQAVAQSLCRDLAFGLPLAHLRLADVTRYRFTPADRVLCVDIVEE